MNINPLNGLRPIALPTSVAEQRVWQVGEIIKAVAVHEVNQGLARFRYNEMVFEANLHKHLRQGEVTRFQVVRGGEKPILLPLNEAPQNKLQQAVTRSLAQQQPLAPIMAKLAAWAGVTASQQQMLSSNAMQQIKQLAANLPQAQNLTEAASLKTAIMQSGPFMESVLAKQSFAPVKDIKLNLMQLMSLLTPVPDKRTDAKPLPTAISVGNKALPPGQGGLTMQRANIPELAIIAGQKTEQLLQEVGAALSRINLLQMLGAQNDAAIKSWWLEIPYLSDKQVEVLPMVIERDDSHAIENEARHRWSVKLAFEFPGLGKLDARISLMDEQVSIHFWACKQEGLNAVGNRLPELAEQIRSDGLSLASLVCDKGVSDEPVYGQYPGKAVEIMA